MAGRRPSLLIIPDRHAPAPFAAPPWASSTDRPSDAIWSGRIGCIGGSTGDRPVSIAGTVGGEGLIADWLAVTYLGCGCYGLVLGTQGASIGQTSGSMASFGLDTATTRARRVTGALGEDGNDVGGRTLCTHQVGHEAHGTVDMVEEGLVPGAEIV